MTTYLSRTSKRHNYFVYKGENKERSIQKNKTRTYQKRYIQKLQRMVIL